MSIEVDLRRLLGPTMKFVDGKLDTVTSGGGGDAVEPFEGTPSPTSATAGAPGSSDLYARGDHVHRDLLGVEELAAIQGAASPSGANVFATMADVGGGGGGSGGEGEWLLPYSLVPKRGVDSWELTFDEEVSTEADLGVLGWSIRDATSGTVLTRAGNISTGRTGTLPTAGTYLSTVQGKQLVIQSVQTVYIHKTIPGGGNWDVIAKAKLSSYGNRTSPGQPSIQSAEVAVCAWYGTGVDISTMTKNLNSLGVLGTSFAVVQYDNSGTLINSGSSTFDAEGPAPDTFIMGVTAAFNTGTTYSNSAGTIAYIGLEGYALSQVNSQYVIGTFPANPAVVGGVKFGGTTSGLGPYFWLLKSIQRKAVT